MSDANTSPPKTPTALWLIAVVAAMPLLAAYLLYFFWRPNAFVNHGELVPGASIADAVAQQPDGTPFEFSRFKGKLLFLMVDSGACDAYCEGKLYRMRQVRLTQGQNMERIERAWIIDDNHAPRPRLIADYEGTYSIRSQDRALLERLPARDSRRGH